MSNLSSAPTIEKQWTQKHQYQKKMKKPATASRKINAHYNRSASQKKSSIKSNHHHHKSRYRKRINWTAKHVQKKIRQPQKIIKSQEVQK